MADQIRRAAVFARAGDDDACRETDRLVAGRKAVDVVVGLEVVQVDIERGEGAGARFCAAAQLLFDHEITGQTRQRADRRLEPRPTDERHDPRCEQAKVERPGEVLVGAGVKRLAQRSRPGHAADHDQRDMARPGVVEQALTDLRPAHVCQVLVADHKVGQIDLRGLQPLQSRRGRAHIVRLGVQV